MIAVKDLIAQLQQLPKDAIVVMSGDGEGNNFSPLAEIEKGVYEADSTWSGVFQTRKIEHEMSAVCLWPVN